MANNFNKTIGTIRIPTNMEFTPEPSCPHLSVTRQVERKLKHS